MTKIEAYFPSHAKRAANFERNLSSFLRVKPEVVKYYFNDYHQEQVNLTRTQISSLKTSKEQITRMERRLDRFDAVTAKETIPVVTVYSELESFLILLNEDIDQLCKLYGGEPVPSAATISELHESDQSRWVFNSIYIFADK